MSANELKINVELDGVQQYEAAKVVFNVSFIFTYGEDEQSSVVPKDLTLNYTPDFEANKVIKSEELPEIKSVNRGDTSFEIEQDSSPFKLNIPLRDHERVRVETTNPYIKANVGIMQVGDKKIPLTLTVDEPSRVEQHTYNFDLLFTVTMDSAAEGPADKITGLTFDYKPYWRNVGVTFQGKTLMIAPEERGGESASMTQNFLLSRKLYAETDEDYDVKVINPTTKEDLQGTVFDYT
ncbi:MAG: hypothetical protein MJ233_03705 [Mycoplasmoidaceae bacterium]|nr:hypothetical protein [Mycoplasmoidaceae bacterium]